MLNLCASFASFGNVEPKVMPGIVHFRIERLELRRPAVHEEEDHRLVRDGELRGFRGGACGEKIGERKSSEPESADAEKFAASHLCAGADGVVEGEHGVSGKGRCR